MKIGSKWLGVPALLALSVTANAGVIDLFSTSQAALVDTTQANGGLSSSVTTVGTDILGSERDLFVSLLNNGGLLSGDVVGSRNATIGVAAGVLDFSVSSLSTGTGVVQWDGIDGSSVLNPTGLGGVDFTGGGVLNSFAVTTLFSDLGYEFLVGAYSSATNWTVISFDAHAVTSSTTSYIPFAGFMNPFLCGAINPVVGVNSITCGSGGTVNFASLGALEFVIDPNGGTTSVDLTLEQVTTVPEPSVLALIGAGLLGVGFSSRRRKAAV